MVTKSRIEPSRGHDGENRSFAWTKAVHKGGERKRTVFIKHCAELTSYLSASKPKDLHSASMRAKKRLADRTIQTYRDVIKAYANYLFRTYGISDIAKAKPRHAYEYMDKQIALYQADALSVSAFTMRRFAHALHAFREAPVQ